MKKLQALLAVALCAAGFASFAEDPAGSQKNPWKIGATDADSVVAYTNWTGNLFVEGAGVMKDFDASAPWAGDALAEAVIGEQVTAIGANAFAGCPDLKTLVMYEATPPTLGEGNDLSGVTVVAPGGAGAAYAAADGWKGLNLVEMRGSPRKVADRLYAVDYEWYDFVLAERIAELVAVDDPLREREYPGSPRRGIRCLAVRKDGLVGRNLDAALADADEHVVRTSAAFGRPHATLAIANEGFFRHANTEMSDAARAALLPAFVDDGINDAGLVVCANSIVSGSAGVTEDTNPEGNWLVQPLVTRYLLDYAGSAAEALEILQSCSTRALWKNKESECHWMIADPNETYVVECVSNRIVALKVPQGKAAAMTNYLLARSPHSGDFEALVGGDLLSAEHTPYARGIERYETAATALAAAATALAAVDGTDAMMTMLNGQRYSQVYAEGRERDFWSEANGAMFELSSSDGSVGNYHTFTVSDGSEFDEARMNFFATERAKSEDVRKKTVHSAVYDIAAKTVRVCVQEDYANTYDFRLVDPTPGSEENPWKIGATDADSVVAYTNWTGNLFVEGAGVMKDFDASAPWAGDALAEAVIGEQVTAIGANAFAGCPDLKTLVMYEATPPALGAGNDLSGVTVVAPGGAGAAYAAADGWKGLNLVEMRGSPRKVADRLYAVDYEWYDFVLAERIAELVAVDDPLKDRGGDTNAHRRGIRCLAVRKDGLVGRNLDAALADADEHVVRTSAAFGRPHATLAIANEGFFRHANTEMSDAARAALLPAFVDDGINDAGLVVCANSIVSGSAGVTEDTNPEGNWLVQPLVTRYLLDYAGSAAEALEILQSCSTRALWKNKESECHWMIADPNETYVVECVSNRIVALKVPQGRAAAMTNYLLARSPHSGEFEALVGGDLLSAEHTPYARGIERYETAATALAAVDGTDAMMTMLNGQRYSQVYAEGRERDFWSEANGEMVSVGSSGGAIGSYHTFTVSDGSEFDEARMNFFAAARAKSEDVRKKTVHSAVYDIAAKAVRVCVQEDYANTYDFRLVDPTPGSEENPWKIGATDADSVVAYTNWTGNLFVEGAGVMKDFDASAPWAGDALAEAVIGEQVTAIGANAFAGCPDLKTLVMYEATPPALGAGNDLSGVTVVAPGGAGAAYAAADGWKGLNLVEMRGSPRKVADRLYAVDYEWYDFVLAERIAELAAVDDPLKDRGGDTNAHRRGIKCLAVRKDGLVGRNLDAALADADEHVVRTSAAFGRPHATLAIANEGFFRHANMEMSDAARAALLPAFVDDGINDAGLVVCANSIVSGSAGVTEDTNPEGNWLVQPLVTRYLLDYAGSAAEALEILQSCSTRALWKNKESECHWMIADPDETYVVECVSNRIVALKVPQGRAAAMTNYLLARSPHSGEFEALVGGDLLSTEHTPYARGIERYEAAATALAAADGTDAMMSLLEDQRYSQVYAEGRERDFWSEANGAVFELSSPDGSVGSYHTFTVSDGSEFDEARMNFFATERAKSEDVRKKTVHSAVYDIAAKTVRVCVQEDYANTYDFRLVPTVKVSLPAGVAGRTLIVSNLTDGVEIMPSSGMPGGAEYELPLGAKVAVYAVAADGYRLLDDGTNPIVIDEVTAETTVDASELPAARSLSEPFGNGGALYPEGDGGVFVAPGKATVYEGVVLDAAGAVAGTVSVKFTKPNAKGLMRVTAKVKTLADGKTCGYKAKNVPTAVNGALELTLDPSNKASAGRAFAIHVEGDSLTGSFDAMTLDAARDVFKRAGDPKRAAVSPLVGVWTGAFACEAGDVCFSVAMKKTGSARVSVRLPDGRLVTSAAKAEVGDGIVAVPVVVRKASKGVATTFGFRLAFAAGEDGAVEAGALDVAPLEARDRSGTVLSSVAVELFAAGAQSVTASEFKAFKVAVDPALEAALGPVVKNGLVLSASSGWITGSLRFGRVTAKASGVMVGGAGIGMLKAKVDGETRDYPFVVAPEIVYEDGKAAGEAWAGVVDETPAQMFFKLRLR